MKTLLLVLVIIIYTLTGKTQSKFPPTIQVNLSNVAYVKLEQISSKIFSAPPLVILDVVKLRNFTCFRNFYTMKYTLGIPIIFWNYSYLQKINNLKYLMTTDTNITTKILPPTGVSSFQINWRRPGKSSEHIELDTSFQRSYLNYFLPMSHTFIVEFNEGNTSKRLCNEIKNSLITEPIQRQELVVNFKGIKTIEEKIPSINIMLSDFEIEPILSCKNGYDSNCYIFLNSAKRFSYLLAINVLKRMSKYNINLQMQIYSRALDELCGIKVIYSSISNQRVVGTAEVVNSQILVCSIPKHFIQYIDRRISDKTIFTIDNLLSNVKEHEYSIPIFN